MTKLLRLQRMPLLLLLALASVMLFAVACGDDDDDDDEETTTSTATTAPTGGATEEPTEDGEGDGGIDYSDLSGSIDVDGSSTVFPISEAVAEEFIGASNVNVQVASSGTGGGFERFCRGEIQVSDASRPIKEDEIAKCADNGIDDIVEIQVAIDALTVMVNPANDFATCLTVDQLATAFKAGGATNWNEIDPSFPDQSISFYYPGADSGTFDYFVEVLEGVDETNTHRDDGTPSEDDNVLALGIEGDQNAIGYFGFAYYLEAGDQLKALEIDGGEGCVAPSFETALDGSYQPLSRPLFIYVRQSELESRPELAGFVQFYLENLETLVPEVGYVTMPDDLLQEQFDKIEASVQ